MRILLTIITYLALACPIMAESTSIQGSVKGFEGEKLRIAAYEDYISYKKVFLGASEIKNGQFKIDFNIEGSIQLMIFIQDKQTSLFAEPGQVYNIQLSYSDESNSARAFEKYLDLRFSYPKPQELNQKIKQFNKDYQDFFSKNYRKFVIKEASKELSEFIAEQESKEEYKEPKYLESYVKYALANLKDINGISKSELYNQYLKKQEVQLQHKEYMNFFKQYYAEDFEQLLITKRGTQLMKSIMVEKDLSKTIELLKELKGIQDQGLAELYLINGLFEVYYKKTVEQQSSLNLLQSLSQNGSSEGIRECAKNVKAKLQQGGEDALAPPFTLKNSKGSTLSLEDLKGKPIYMGFWANWSVVSLRELKLIQRLEEEYGQMIHFVSINIDENQEYYRKVQVENEYGWPFLYGGNEYELRDKYEVRTAPVYHLIDEQGRFIKRFAPGPENIRKDLKALAGEI